MGAALCRCALRPSAFLLRPLRELTFVPPERYFNTIFSSCKAADFLLGRLTPMMVFSLSQAVKSFT